MARTTDKPTQHDGGFHESINVQNFRYELRALRGPGYQSAVDPGWCLDGVRVDQVKLGEATIGYEPQQITPAEIQEAINEAGYQAQLTGRAI